MTTPHPGLSGGPVYLDYNATTPVDPSVAAVALPYLHTQFGNPSSSHRYADAPRAAISQSREQVAALLGCRAEEIVYTGGGSEGDTLALRGVVLAHGGRGDHVITQQTEHPAVLQTCRSLQRLHGVRVTYLRADQYGLVDPGDLEEAITPRTVLVSIMHANNETGTVQPIRDLAAITRRHGVLLHSDPAQSVGKIPVSVEELGIDLLSIAGHKLYAPKGVGALYVRAGVRLEPSVYGGGQERGVRAGTENVALIAALGQAALIARTELPDSQTRLRRLRDLLQARLQERLHGRVRLNGHPTHRLPNTLNVSIDGAGGEQLLAATPGVAASTGSACHEGHDEPSGVLLAMGMSRERALSAVRLSVGRWTSEEDVEYATAALAQGSAQI